MRQFVTTPSIDEHRNNANRSVRGHFGPSPHDHLGVELPGIYWHFVDVMWIVVYVTVYVL